jgi:hypothetical protein
MAAYGENLMATDTAPAIKKSSWRSSCRPAARSSSAFDLAVNPSRPTSDGCRGQSGARFVSGVGAVPRHSLVSSSA